MWGPRASLGRQLAGKGLPQHCLTSRLFESIVGKPTAGCDWALGRAQSGLENLQRPCGIFLISWKWWWSCVLGHAATVFGKLGEGVNNFRKERLYRCGKTVHLVESLCVGVFALLGQLRFEPLKYRAAEGGGGESEASAPARATP